MVSGWILLGSLKTLRRSDTTAVCGTLAAVALFAMFDPVTTWWFPSCPLHAWTGWLCPFCGSLRALHALLHGEPRVALAFNPLMTVGLAAGLVALAHDVVSPTQATALDRLTGLCFSGRGLFLLFAFGLFRNLAGRVGGVLY
jgi:hypothetical protein